VFSVAATSVATFFLDLPKTSCSSDLRNPLFLSPSLVNFLVILRLFFRLAQPFYCPSVRPWTILIIRIWIRWNFFFHRVRPIIRRLRSFRLKCFEFYANFAKLKRRLRSFRLKRFEFHANFAKLKGRLRSFRLKRFEVYANFARLSTLI